MKGGATPALDWLDAHWHGPAPTEIMMAQQEAVRMTLETAIGGLPVLVVVVRAGWMTSFSGKLLHVLVAAPKQGPRYGAPAVAAEVARQGFEVKVSEDGLPSRAKKRAPTS